MARASKFDGDIVVAGTVQATTLNGSLNRSKIAQDELANFPVLFTDFRVWDAMQTVLPGTAATDDLALIGGTFGTNAPMIKSRDFASNGTPESSYARAIVPIPPEYDDGQTLQIRIRAKMETVSDTTATLDVEAYKFDGDGAVGSDLCATSAIDINSASWADNDFTITATGVVSGELLDIRVAVTVEDGATGSGVIVDISEISLLADIRG